MTSIADLAQRAHTDPPSDPMQALALAEDACRALAALADRDRCDPRAVHRDVDNLLTDLRRGLPPASEPKPTWVKSQRCPVCIGVASDCICTRPTRGVVTR